MLKKRSKNNALTDLKGKGWSLQIVVVYRVVIVDEFFAYFFAICIQGVRGQSGFFDLALRERNIQVRLCLKVVLKFWDVDILIIRTIFKKSNLGWPQQPPTKKVQK